MSKEEKVISLEYKTSVRCEENAITVDIPLWQKYTLSVEEAARYLWIGRAKLRKLIDENNRDLISSSMILNELFGHYVKTHILDTYQQMQAMAYHTVS